MSLPSICSIGSAGVEPFQCSSSSTICSATLFSSSIVSPTSSISEEFDHDDWDVELWLDVFFRSSTFITHWESKLLPARFCHTPMLELELSSLKHVMEGAGFLQLFFSFAPSISDSILWDDEGEFVLDWSWSEPLVAFGKFVFALWPFIKIAASSYALAAASAVSNVPSQILFFLHTQYQRTT